MGRRERRAAPGSDTGTECPLLRWPWRGVLAPVFEAPPGHGLTAPLTCRKGRRRIARSIDVVFLMLIVQVTTEGTGTCPFKAPCQH